MTILNNTHMAGKPDRYSNLTTPSVDALYFFARSLPHGKTIEDLEKLVADLRTSNVKRPPRMAEKPSVSDRLGTAGVASLVAQYQAGGSLESVAEAHGISTSSARRLLLRQGVTLRLPRISTDMVNRAAELYESGLGVLAIANELGVAKSSLLRAMKKAGVQLRPPKH
jgi:transposase-like protein